MNNKKALSTIVATVLIILITMAAVTVVWLAVMPLISKQTATSSSCFDAVTKVSLVEGSSCYKVVEKDVSIQPGTSPYMGGLDKTNSKVKFIVKQGGSATPIESVDLIAVLQNGNSKKVTRTLDATTEGSNTNTLVELTASQLKFDATPQGLADFNSIVSLSVAPKVKGSKDTCEVSSVVPAAACMP
ncbi:MAG: hypothetical protein Q7S33_00930 [Nanoarchaeota archaeon]|nr:hypothetical protein [Nanoarchaeota archaeon]